MSGRGACPCDSMDSLAARNSLNYSVFHAQGPNQDSACILQFFILNYSFLIVNEVGVGITSPIGHIIHSPILISSAPHIHIIGIQSNRRCMYMSDSNPKGQVTFADDVIATIAGLAAVSIQGTAGMSGGLVGGIAEFLGKKNFSKGVKVDVQNGEVIVHLLVIAEYGVPIPQVCDRIQDAVKRDVETMTGYSVNAVNIHIQGIRVNKDDSKED